MSTRYRFAQGLNWLDAAGTSYAKLLESLWATARDTYVFESVVEREFWQIMSEIEEGESIQVYATGQVFYDPDVNTEEAIRDPDFWSDILKDALDELVDRLLG